MNLIDKLKKQEKYTKYSIYLIIIFSIIVITLASVYHVSGDGCWHMPVGKYIAKEHKFPLFEPLGRDEPFWSPPLYHIAIAAVYSIFSIFWGNIANSAPKFIPPFFGILSLAFSFLTIRKLLNSRTAFYSILFMAFVPIFIDYSVLSYAESILVFFVVLSVYLLINNKIALSGIAAGLSILAKYNGVFILPILIYILYKRNDKKAFLKKSMVLASFCILIAMPWLIRNWILLGNPIWPFLNFIFSGIEAKSYSTLDFSRIVHPNIISFTLLGFFGVPDGNYAAFSFFDLPLIRILLPLWLVASIVFITPAFIGIFHSKKAPEAKIFILWLSSYFILFLLYVLNVGWSVSRMLLPAFPALAVFWAFGYKVLMQKAIFRKTAFLILVIAAGLVFSEFIKFILASNEWSFYNHDFEWVRQNTAKESVFIASGQCIPYNIERTSLHFSEENIKNADYLWLNQNFRLDKRSVLSQNEIQSIHSRNFKIAYDNKSTGTRIYQIKQ